MSRREQLEELLETDPDDVFLNYALALEYVSDGEVAEGLQKLADLTDRNPDYVAAYFRRGQILADQDDVRLQSRSQHAELDLLALGFEDRLGAVHRRRADHLQRVEAGLL